MGVTDGIFVGDFSCNSSPDLEMLTCYLGTVWACVNVEIVISRSTSGNRERFSLMIRLRHDVNRADHSWS